MSFPPLENLRKFQEHEEKFGISWYYFIIRFLSSQLRVESFVLQELLHQLSPLPSGFPSSEESEEMGGCDGHVLFEPQ